MIFGPRSAKKKEEGSPTSDSEALHYVEKKDETPRIMGICGDLDEEKAGELMYGMIALYEEGASYKLKDPIDESSEILVSYSPFEFIISHIK